MPVLRMAPHAATPNTDSAPHAARWQVLRIPGDGRCLFRSLAQGRALQRSGSLLDRQQETAAADSLRRDICNKLVEQRDMMSPFIDGDFDAYVDNMRQPTTWVRHKVVGEDAQPNIRTHVFPSRGGSLSLQWRQTACKARWTSMYRCATRCLCHPATESCGGFMWWHPPQEAGGVSKYSSYGEDQYQGTTPPIPLLFYRAGHYDLLVDANTNPLPRM